MKLLFIGRFQPFHKKHLEILERIDKNGVEIIIAVAAAQYSHTKENPFTYCERQHMISIAVEEANFKTPYLTIIPLPDINDKHGWVDYVKKVVGAFDAVVTNNPNTEELFEEKGYLIVNVKEKTQYSHRNMMGKGISGTWVREEIAQHTNLWKVAVTKPVVKYIKEIGGDERIRKLYGMAEDDNGK